MVAALDVRTTRPTSYGRSLKSGLQPALRTGCEPVALSRHHDVAGPDCGTPPLNTWLAEQALRAQQAGTARTFVWVTAEAPERVWAYSSLAPAAAGFYQHYDFTPVKGNQHRLVLKMANVPKLLFG